MAGLAAKLLKKAFEEAKHKRGQGGKFASKGLGEKAKSAATGKAKSAAESPVKKAHAIYDKLGAGTPKKEMLAAAQAVGVNPNTAKTQLYHWQKAQAKKALGQVLGPNPAAKVADLPKPKEALQAVAAKALGVPQVKAPKPAKEPELPKLHKAYGDAKEALEKAGYKKHTTYQYVHPEKGKATLTSASDGKWQITTARTADPAPVPKPAPAPAPKPPVATPPAPKPAPAPAPTPKLADQPDLATLGPVKYTHALADSMPDAPKKAVVAAAVKAGVNPSTASVQYGKWAKAKNGELPQLAKAPEPKALQAKPANEMTDKELATAVDSYHGKLNWQSQEAKFAAKPYNSAMIYYPKQGDKALTIMMGKNDIYTHPTSGKTFYKDGAGGVHEFKGDKAGPMTLLTPNTKDGFTYHYDPATKLVAIESGGKVKPFVAKKPVFKNDQPPPDWNNTQHAFNNHAWANVNGVQDPDHDGSVGDYLTAIHAKAGTTYSESYAIDQYTSSGYININGKLRATKGTVVDKRTTEIDDLIAKSSFQEETIMWRGVGKKNPDASIEAIEAAARWNGAPPPPELMDHAFTSTSFKPQTAKGFSNGKTMFRVKVPKGFPGLNVAIGQPGSGVQGLHGEAEVMLPRGTTYKVIERHAGAASNGNMDIVDLVPVLPDWYIKKYGAPKLG